MTTIDPLTILNPSIVGQTEKAHTAILHRIAALTGAELVSEVPGDGRRLIVTEAGRVVVDKLRGDTRQAVARAYGAIPTEDLVTAARVLTAITATLSEELAANEN